MVLDTHRMLLPDIPWINWIESDEAAPRVWAVSGGEMQTVFRGMLRTHCEVRRRGMPDLATVCEALNKWNDTNAIAPAA